MFPADEVGRVILHAVCVGISFRQEAFPVPIWFSYFDIVKVEQTGKSLSHVRQVSITCFPYIFKVALVIYRAYIIRLFLFD